MSRREKLLECMEKLMIFLFSSAIKCPQQIPSYQIGFEVLNIFWSFCCRLRECSLRKHLERFDLYYFTLWKVAVIVDQAYSCWLFYCLWWLKSLSFFLLSFTTLYCHLLNNSSFLITFLVNNDIEINDMLNIDLLCCLNMLEVVPARKAEREDVCVWWLQQEEEKEHFCYSYCIVCSFAACHTCTNWWQYIHNAISRSNVAKPSCLIVFDYSMGCTTTCHVDIGTFLCSKWWWQGSYPFYCLLILCLLWWAYADFLFLAQTAPYSSGSYHDYVMFQYDQLLKFYPT